MGLALMGLVLVFGSLRLTAIAAGQGELLFGFLPAWGGVVQPVGFVLFLTAVFAETNRNPFDLPECESELVNGYFTEYSGVKFALFYMAEYANILVVSCLSTILFLGGWLPPFPSLAVWQHLPSLPLFWFLAKVFVFIFFYIWVRATFPRYRFDQLMGLMWKWMLPLALANLILLALVKLWLLK
jgi:NADH-quinone oxidoreductase subunit H